MAVGSMLIVILFYVSRLAPLQTVNWMIRNMLVYVAFAAIVIFQSDIRRALAHFGQAPFFRYFNRQEAANETIEEVVVAATMLAAQKVGAIVAIEREIGLRNYIESGIPLDATLTYDLLVTIFQPGSPLHDGAVILQESRVAAAACFLPLTVNPKVEPRAGHAPSRRDRPHRGERRRRGGRVGGDRVRSRWRSTGVSSAGSRRDQLRERLRSLVLLRRSSRAQRRRPHLRRLMAYHPFRNLGLKIMAVLLATALWFTVAGEHDVERMLRVPLEFRNKPAHARDRRRSADDGRRPRRRLVGGAQPHRRGRGRRGARPGAPRVRDRGCSTSAPTRSARRSASSVLQVTPSTIALELENSAKRVMPVRPAIDGDPAPGFVVGASQRRPRDGRGDRPARAASRS